MVHGLFLCWFGVKLGGLAELPLHARGIVVRMTQFGRAVSDADSSGSGNSSFCIGL